MIFFTGLHGKTNREDALEKLRNCLPSDEEPVEIGPYLCHRDGLPLPPAGRRRQRPGRPAPRRRRSSAARGASPQHVVQWVSAIWANKMGRADTHLIRML